MPQSKYKGIPFTDSDFVNLEDYLFALDQKGNLSTDIKLYLIHDHGFVLGVVCAENDQTALDILVDKTDKLNHLKRDDEDAKSPTDYQFTYLGNYYEPYDIESIDIIELPKPQFSFCALFNNLLENQQKN